MSIPNGLNPTIQNLTIYDGALPGGNSYSSKPLNLIQAYTYDTTAGVRQGLLSINLERAATNVLATWDGNGDIGQKIQVTNRSVSGTNGGLRGLEISTRNRASGTLSWLNTQQLTAENSTDGGSIVSSTVSKLIMKNFSTITTSAYGLEIQDTSEGTNPTATYMLRFATGSNAPASGARKALINIASSDSAGFTNLIFAESAGGVDCATVGAGTYSTADGYFTVNVAGSTYRIPFFAGTD